MCVWHSFICAATRPWKLSSAFQIRWLDSPRQTASPAATTRPITWAFLLLIRERMARAGCQLTWPEFASRNADLLNWEDNVLKKYYRNETLSSDLAKSTFLLPDKTISPSLINQFTSRSCFCWRVPIPLLLFETSSEIQCAEHASSRA